MFNFYQKYSGINDFFASPKTFQISKLHLIPLPLLSLFKPLKYKKKYFVLNNAIQDLYWF